jgi:predicted NUDIX family NTP pyrophosphohydrolase
MYRRDGVGVEVFLVHPGGPLYRRKDVGVWTIPKGEMAEGEDPEEVARREFAEETGRSVEACARNGQRIALGSIRQRSGKVVFAWAFEGDWPAGAEVVSNTFTMEWPPRSGRTAEFPEVDAGEFFSLTQARERIHPDQAALLDRLLEELR